nr:hypothetical protein [Tanacetum cinerariifolium]
MRLWLSGLEVGSSEPKDCLLILLHQDRADDSGPASPKHLSGLARARLATSTQRQLRLSYHGCLKETIPYHMHINTLRAELVYSDLLSVLDASMFSLMKIGKPGPTNGTNVEAYLCGPLELGKRPRT